MLHIVSDTVKSCFVPAILHLDTSDSHFNRAVSNATKHGGQRQALASRPSSIFPYPKSFVRASMVEEGFMATSMATNGENGILRLQGNHPVDETVAKLQGILQAKGVKLFTIVDHSGEAAAAGLKMPNTKLLIFGNPQAGTPLMLASPSAALDFPLKILVAEDAAGKTWISYNSTAYLQTRHGLPANLVPNIAVNEVLAAKIAE